MTPITCSLCGAPLPAVAADHRHPDWCPTCVARATGDIGPAPSTDASVAHAARPSNAWASTPAYTAPSPLILASPMRRYLEGTLIGIATAALCGVVWWAVSALGGVDFPYLAALLGLVVGNGVLIGTRRGGGLAAMVAVATVLGALAVAQYFIERSLAIKQAGLELPLWNGFSFAWEVVSESLTNQPMRGLSWVMAAVVAIVAAGSPKRRAVL